MNTQMICKNCEHFVAVDLTKEESTIVENLTFGRCNKVEDSDFYPMDENIKGELGEKSNVILADCAWVGENFGCIHFEIKK